MDVVLIMSIGNQQVIFLCVYVCERELPSFVDSLFAIARAHSAWKVMSWQPISDDKDGIMKKQLDKLQKN